MILQSKIILHIYRNAHVHHDAAKHLLLHLLHNRIIKHLVS